MNSGSYLAPKRQPLSRPRHHNLGHNTVPARARSLPLRPVNTNWGGRCRLLMFVFRSRRRSFITIGGGRIHHRIHYRRVFRRRTGSGVLKVAISQCHYTLKVSKMVKLFNVLWHRESIPACELICCWYWDATAATMDGELTPAAWDEEEEPAEFWPYWRAGVLGRYLWGLELEESRFSFIYEDILEGGGTELFSHGLLKIKFIFSN